MTVTPTQAQKILTGNSTFSQLGFSMLLTRLKRVYSKDPSHASLQKCTAEINTFLKKYAPIMAPDFAIISKL
ncbi:MAG: hypothetical protein LBS18_01745 [Clostridiales bacterium]|jgi:hypothetical protein|nr:hypothetical protein [Clostridiales bacterium]